MTRGINNVFIIGSLAHDPELRYTPSGVAVLQCVVAGDSRVLGSDGQERSIPFYQRASLVGRQAERLSGVLRAATPVLLEGTLEYRTWETPEGERRSRLEVKALRLEALQHDAQTALVTDSSGGVRLTNAINRVTLLGHLTRDAESRVTPNGFSVTTLGLAVNNAWKDDQGQWQERPSFVDVTLWRDLADQHAQTTKGSAVLVTGRLVSESWQDPSGTKRYALKVEADRVERLEPQERKPEQPSAPASAVSRGRKPGAKNKKGQSVDAAPANEDLPF